jgi:probable F420-dependent oxidoreductase
MSADALTYGFVTQALPADNFPELEALGYHALWIGGHVAPQHPSSEVVVHLARMAALTSTIRIGSAVLLLPVYPPAIVAKQFAELDRISGGRVTLGIGVGGEQAGDFNACGVPVGERGARTDETLPLLRRLWSGESVTHAGRFFSMQDVRIQPPPVQPGGPPIVVAGRKAAAMRRAAVLGDGWMPYLYTPQQYAHSVAEIRAIADRAGRDLSDFEWMAFVIVDIADHGPDARERAGTRVATIFKLGDPSFVHRIGAVGTPDEVAARLQEFIDAGARHLIVAGGGGGDPMELARRFVSEVKPLLKVPPARVGVSA